MGWPTRPYEPAQLGVETEVGRHNLGVPFHIHQPIQLNNGHSGFARHLR
jgi:hypothetical protein